MPDLDPADSCWARAAHPWIAPRHIETKVKCWYYHPGSPVVIEFADAKTKEIVANAGWKSMRV
jgi:hypothetical protein